METVNRKNAIKWMVLAIPLLVVSTQITKADDSKAGLSPITIELNNQAALSFYQVLNVKESVTEDSTTGCKDYKKTFEWEQFGGLTCQYSEGVGRNGHTYTAKETAVCYIAKDVPYPRFPGPCYLPY